MRQRDHLVRSAAIIVQVGGIANRLFLVAVVTGLAATWLVSGFFNGLLAEANAAVDVSDALFGIRLLMMIGIVMAIVIDRMLVSMSAVISSAANGDPFAPDNARRIRTIGWALLTLQLLDIPCALLARFWPSLGSAAPSGDVSLGGWAATLMVFVLARVFTAGSVMREDLAGTV